MNVIYLRDKTLETRLNELTFGELRGMLSEIKDENRVPRPETLIKNLRNRFLEASEDDFSIRIYTGGVCLYQENGGASAYSVSRCATLVFSSVSGEYAEEIRADDLPWRWPLIITGQERLWRNQESVEQYHTIHFEAGIPAELTPYTPDFVTDVSSEIENQRRRLHILRDELPRMTRCMTERQRQVFLLRYQYGMKPGRISAYLGIGAPSVCDALRRARQKVKRLMDH